MRLRLGLAIGGIFILILPLLAAIWKSFADDEDGLEMTLGLMALVVAGAIAWLGRERLGAAAASTIIFLFLAGSAIPGLPTARSRSERSACICNLRFIAKAKNEWAEKNGKMPGDLPTRADLYGTNGFLRNRPECPRRGSYIIGRVGEDPTCGFADKGHKL